MQLGKADLLKDIESVEDLETTIRTAFEAVIGNLPEDINFAECYAEIFATFRRPEALMQYAATLSKGLSEYERKPCMQALNTFVCDVLRGNFEEQRYSYEGDDSHLALAFKSLGKEGTQAWKRGESAELDEFIEASSPPTTPKGEGAQDYYESTFRDAINHNHLGEH